MDSETRVKSILFPTEVLLCILHHCDYRSILRFSTTCKNAYEIVRQSISLQLHIELEVNGLEIANIDRSSDRSHDCASILEELKDYRNAWLNFRLGPETLKQVRKPTGYNPRYELNNETYFRAFHQLVHDEDSGSEGSPTSDYIQVVKFNPLVHSPLLKFKSVHEFAVESNRDLIVLVEYDKEYERYQERFKYTSFRRVHLYLHHLTTGEPHSLARFPIITVQLRSLDGQPWGFTHGCPIIMKELLVVHFVRRILIGDPSLHGDPSTDGEILIWNWRSGALLGRINCGIERTNPVFLDESHLVVYSPFSHLNTESEAVGLNQIALFVYRVPNAPASHEEIITPHIHVPSCTVLDPVLIFEFPKLHPAYEIFSYDLGKSLALPGDLAYRRSAEVVHSHTTTLALHLVTWRINEEVPGLEQPEVLVSNYGYAAYFIFVNTGFISNYLSENRLGQTTRVPWPQWGPAATRWFADRQRVRPRRNYILPEIHGSLCLKSDTSSNVHTYVLSIAEFNPQIVKRHTPCALGEIDKREVLMGTWLSSTNSLSPNTGTDTDQGIAKVVVGSDVKTVIRAGFEDPVESTLPYIIVTRQEPVNAHVTWRIHGDYLVGIVSGTNAYIVDANATIWISKGRASCGKSKYIFNPQSTPVFTQRLMTLVGFTI